MDGEKKSGGCCMCSAKVREEFAHLKADWWWLLLFGILLSVCGLAAVIFPTLTAMTTYASMVVLGVALMIAGIATIIMLTWAGKWSGQMVQLLIGILYIVAGVVITDTPIQSALVMTMFLAAFFIVAGIFRTVAALIVRFPYWGAAMLNGIITFLLGVVIYRHLPQSAVWVLGILIGIEMIFNGWTWIMLALAVRKISDDVA
jgi:uncharacterized membrane protein HdeD (DUF308 family)